MMMNHADIIALVRALKECGTNKFKFGEFQIEFSEKQNATQPITYAPVPVAAPVQPAPQTSVDAEAERAAAKRIKEMLETLHARPEDLADRIFPVGPNT